MNLSLKITCTRWIDVDLESCSRIQTVLVLVFLFKSFSEWVCLRIRWFTTVDTRCKPWNLYGFQRFLGFHDFEPKLFESSTNLHRFGFVTALEYERGKFRCSPVFYSGIRTGIFKISSILILFVDFVAWIPKINWCFFSSSPVQNLWTSSLFFSISLLCDRIGFVAFRDGFNAWIAEGIGSMMKIHHWISESCHEFHGFGLNSVLEKVRVGEIVLELSEFLVNLI